MKVKREPSVRQLLAKAYKMLRAGIPMDRKFANAETVAVMTGPAIIIEAVVAQAEAESKIPMDWGYQGGYAYIQALGDRKKARSALISAIPNSDLTLADL